MWVLFYVLHESAKTASLCIPQVGEGGDERIFFFGGGGGFLKLFEGKRGDGKNLLRQEGGRPMFLDAIERLNICVFIDKPLPTLIVGSKFTVFALFILYLREIFHVQAPGGAI